MGGSIAVTLREPDGTEHRMCRWTNILPWMCLSVGTFKKSRRHIREILKQWEDMGKDWEANKDTGKFKYRMTPCYHPFNLLAPDDYGLVVLDMKSNVILTMQNYTGLTTLTVPAHESIDPDRFDQVKKLLAAGRIQGWDGFWKSSTEPITKPLPPGTTWEQFLELHEKMWGDPDFFLRGVLIDTNPFKVEKFRRDEEGIRAFRQRVLDLGFVLTPEDEARWTKWLEEVDQ